MTEMHEGPIDAALQLGSVGLTVALMVIALAITGTIGVILLIGAIRSARRRKRNRR